MDWKVWLKNSAPAFALTSNISPTLKMPIFFWIEAE
jgi:hypothetical protein